jgi:hypothetical protein
VAFDLSLDRVNTGPRPKGNFGYLWPLEHSGLTARSRKVSLAMEAENKDGKMTLEQELEQSYEAAAQEPEQPEADNQQVQDELPPEPEPEVQPEPEPETEEPKPEKRVVPEATFLEVKNRMKNLERENAELRSSRQPEETKFGPTTYKELVEAGEVEPGDLLTVEQQVKLEENRQRRDDMTRSRNNQNNVAIIAEQFRATVPQSHISAGLSSDDVINQDNALNLNGSDWREMNSLPPGSIDRLKFLYNRIIERTPQLKTTREKLLKADRLRPKEPKTNNPPRRSGPSSLASIRSDSHKTPDELLSEIEAMYPG